MMRPLYYLAAFVLIGVAFHVLSGGPDSSKKAGIHPAQQPTPFTRHDERRELAGRSLRRKLAETSSNRAVMTPALRTMLGLDMKSVSYTGPALTRKECLAKSSPLRYFSPSEERVPPMLYTYPGSGNTWGRLLIEHASGIYTGSVYSDPTLVSELPGELTCDHTVSVIKVHPHTHVATRLLNGGFNSDHMKCKKGQITKFAKAILLVRDPFDSIWSEFQRRITQSHVKGIPESYMDWRRWQANAASMANSYFRMWQEHYTLIEESLDPHDVLYLKYEDLRNPATRVNALHLVTQFLGLDITPEKLHCSFVLAENPGARRVVAEGMMSKDMAYTRPLVCRMWALFGAYAARIGYSRRGDFEDCPEEHNVPIRMVNVGPQGDYNDGWVKEGQPFMDYGEHPPDGPNAGKRLFGPMPGVELINGYNPGPISNGPNSSGGRGATRPRERDRERPIFKNGPKKIHSAVD